MHSGSYALCPLRSRCYRNANWHLALTWVVETQTQVTRIGSILFTYCRSEIKFQMHEFYKKHFCWLIISLKFTTWNSGLFFNNNKKYSFMSCMVVNAFKQHLEDSGRQIPRRLRPASSTERVLKQSGIHSEILSWKKQQYSPSLSFALRMQSLLMLNALSQYFYFIVDLDSIEYPLNAIR